VPEQYCRDVLDGKIIACKWVKLACQRHLRDLERGYERGLWFDESAGTRAIRFFSFLKHSKGQWAGEEVILEPWQQFILWCVFGWKRPDGTRRFRSVYEEVARKNGKSTKLAGIGLYMLVADGEAGAEIYSAATKRDQAKIMWVEAARMAKKSPGLDRLLDIFGDRNPKATACSISVAETGSKYEPLGRDADSMDGLNVHCALIDELHAHKTRDMVDILDTATGSRRQPLIWMITTAGFNRQTICYETREYSERVLAGLIEDDSFFGIVFTLDEDDDWEDERNWVKANPNLGVSKRLDDMRAKATKAKEMPTALNAFLRLELNIWTQAETRWINLEHWDACNKPFAIETLRGRECYGGLDLSSTLDTTALVLVFPPATLNDDYIALSYFWVPDDNIMKRVKRDRFPYDLWQKRGLIEATPGEVVDYDFIQAKIEELARLYDIREVAFDRWNATSLINRLAERHVTKLIEFGQGYAGMSPAAKLFESKYVSHQINHLGNPVLSWMAGNVVVTSDPAGNIKPDKDKSIERIDGIVALMMALDRASRPGISVYEDRGILVL
jgi:phage terminase large subunit-like protein